MLKKVYSAAVLGLSGELIEVETDISPGLPATIIVGLPDNAIRESRERVKSALKHAGCQFPKGRLAINLAPADLPKIGSHYDLPIAISILLNSGQLNFDPGGKLFVGELALDGQVREVPGALVIADCAKKAGFDTLFVPEKNVREAGLIKGIRIVSVRTISGLARQLAGSAPLTVYAPSASDEPETEIDDRWDFRHIRGQELAKRAVEIAAAGMHNVLMTGPPGSGKTLLARALSSILPKLGYDEALEVTKIYSVAGLLAGGGRPVSSRPFRSPHHTSSAISLVGGGSDPRPGEISLSHRGVLFLDELPEFPRSVLESLRQPLEDGVIHVARAARRVRFPAEFMLIAAQNPCPCGYSGDPEKMCVCSGSALARYGKKVSGPLLDRFDLHVEVPRLSFEKIQDESEQETSEKIRARVEAARAVQLRRFEAAGLAIRTNAEMGAREIKIFCRPGAEGLAILRNAVNSQHLSARAYHRVLKLSRTIADLFGQDEITARNVAEALMFRPKEN